MSENLAIQASTTAQIAGSVAWRSHSPCHTSPRAVEFPILLSGDVNVCDKNGKIQLHLEMVLHAEDRYNFNPGQQDIVTGIPDNENCIFEITGLAKQHAQTAELKRIIEWEYGTLIIGGTSTVTIPRRR